MHKRESLQSESPNYHDLTYIHIRIISLEGTLCFSLSLVFTRNGILIAPYNSSKCLSIKSVCLVRKDDDADTT